MFVINRYDFVVRIVDPIDVGRLVDCRVFPTAQALFEAIGSSLPEVESAQDIEEFAYAFQQGMLWCDRGVPDEPDEDVELFLSNYQL